jgi:putative PIN family toxin of toxin-antitoxin system
VRLILDTSIVIAATRSSQGASRILLDGALLRDFELLLSVPLTLEYESVLLRPHQLAQSGLSRDEIETLLASLLQVAVKIDLDEYAGPHSVDPDDDHVLSLAFQGAADAIVTHNIRHFERPSQMLGVGLYTPGEALRLLRS